MRNTGNVRIGFKQLKRGKTVHFVRFDLNLTWYYIDRFNSCKENIKTGAQNVLSDQLKVIEELLAQQTSANLLLNNTIELGEKLYPTTAVQGRQIISKQLQDLQQAIESIYDGINSTNRELKSKLSR